MASKEIEEVLKKKTETLIEEADTLLWALRKRKDIIPLKNNNNVIKVYKDPSCEMASVFLNGKELMMGNYWDFHPGCHGGALRVLGYITGNTSWQGVTGLISMLSNHIYNMRMRMDGYGIDSSAKTTIEIYHGTWTHNKRPWKNLKLQKSEIV